MKKIKTIADLLRYISENSILLKTELNHIGIISISMILVTIFYAFSIDIGFGVININTFLAIDIFGVIVIMSIFYEIYRKVTL